jgi:hypothetical protein
VVVFVLCPVEMRRIHLSLRRCFCFLLTLIGASVVVETMLYRALLFSLYVYNCHRVVRCLGLMMSRHR